ncbi:hypothetical protein GCM10023088_33160 [Actinomadura verrucosospora]
MPLREGSLERAGVARRRLVLVPHGRAAQAPDGHGAQQHRGGHAEGEGRERGDGRHVQERPAEQARDAEVGAAPSRAERQRQEGGGDPSSDNTLPRL